MKIRVLRDYSGKTDGQLGDFGLHIATKMLGSVIFTTPPFPLPTLTTTATNFNTAVAACVNGTPADTLNKKNLRATLLAMLDQLASYVDLTANGDPVKILAAGFNHTSPAHAPLVPGMTSITAVANVASGKLGLTLTVAENAWAYIVEYTALPSGGGPVTATASAAAGAQTKTFTDPHGLVLTDLISGTTYSIRVQVMGSGNQTTEFCEAVTHMAT